MTERNTHFTEDERIARLIDCLRHRPVATTAAQKREAADELQALSGRCSAVIGRMHRLERAMQEIEAILELSEWYDDSQVDLLLDRLGRIVEPFIDREPPEPDGECFRGGEAAAHLAEQQAAAQRLK